MPIPTSIRSEFSFLDNNTIYLNNAAIGPLPDQTVAAINRSLKNRLSRAVDSFDTDGIVIEETRTKLATLIGANSSDSICFTSNTTDAINILANGYPFDNGTEVLIHPTEFPTNVYPWLHQQKRGLSVRYLPDDNGRIFSNTIENMLRPETAVLAISAVQFVSGFRADLKEIVRICHNNNTKVFVDGIQSVGQLKIDVEDLGIDALSCGCHKWMLAPQGIGFLYLNDELLSTLNDTKPGWLSPVEPWDFFNYKQPMKSCARRFEGGTYNLPGIYGLGASVDFHLKYKPEQIESHILNLSKLIKDGMKELGILVFSDETPTYQSGISTFRLPESFINQNHDLTQLAYDRNLHLSERDGMMRLAPHCFNTISDIEKAIGILDEIFNLYAL